MKYRLKKDTWCGQKEVEGAVGVTLYAGTELDLEPVEEEKAWEPGKNEAYYYIRSDGVIELEIDTKIDRIPFGNYFKTRELAEAARDKVRECLKKG